MKVSEQFHNIENVQGGGKGHRLLGYAHSGRVFRVNHSGHTAAERWIARAITPREGAVNEFRCATLDAVSNRLTLIE